MLLKNKYCKNVKKFLQYLTWVFNNSWGDIVSIKLEKEKLREIIWLYLRWIWQLSITNYNGTVYWMYTKMTKSTKKMKNFRYAPRIYMRKIQDKANKNINNNKKTL